MSGKVRHLLNRDGRYFARLVVPKELRPYLENKTELRQSLGADRRIALSSLPTAVAGLQHQISQAERRAQIDTGQPVEPGRYPLAFDQIALNNYHARLAFDEELRNASPYYSRVGIDDRLVLLLRSGIAGSLDDDTLETLVGSRIDHYRRLGNTTVKKGTQEWRTLARSMCVSELEALARVAERDDGDYNGKPENPILINLEPPVEELPPVSLKGLFNSYISELRANGKGEEAARRWGPVIHDLIYFQRSDDANKLTKKTLLDWKDDKLKTLAPRTVKDVYLTAVKAVLNWAVANDRLDVNIAQHVKLRVAAKVQSRPKGFTRDEATAILSMSLSYVAPNSDNPQTREAPQTSAAKKWAPLICAFTGSRITEVTQLRKSDIFEEDGIHVMRITPDAGSVKNGKFRDVPLHRQIIEQGFLEFVKASPDGPLFYLDSKRRSTANPAQTVSGRVSVWLQKQDVIPEGVSPNHGWRHAFKTTGRDAEIDTRILEAIQGHAARGVGDSYGDVTIIAKNKAIDRLPAFILPKN